MLAVRRSVERARAALEREGVPPADFLAPDIYDSWMRCIGYGSDCAPFPRSRKSYPMAELRREHQRHSLGSRTRARRKCIRCICRSPGTNFMIAFASPGRACCSTFVSDNSFKDHVGRREHPSRRDLEGVGVRHQRPRQRSRICKRAVTVHGGEHFFPRYNNLTCTAVPGVRARWRALSGDSRRVVGLHVPAGAHASAWSAWRRPRSRTDCSANSTAANIIITFHNRGEYLHTLSAGLLASITTGAILAANRAGQALLHRAADLAGSRLRRRVPHAFQCVRRGGRRQRNDRSLQDEVGSQFVGDRSRTPASFRSLRTRLEAKAARHRSVSEPEFVSADPERRGNRARGSERRRAQDADPYRGETGTGKEQLARYAHAASRRSGAFVPVNCAALPESLIEAELFGYTEGAFTGARKGGSVGLFREADGGTLFLDEIGDMPVALQAVLLRVSSTIGPFVPWRGIEASWTCCSCRRPTPISATRSPKAVSVPTCCFDSTPWK